MAQGAIPLTEIEAYLRMQDIFGDEAFQWLYLIREMDREYLTVKSEQENSK